MSLIIKRHMMLLGPTAALACARRVPNITLAENGDVLTAAGNPDAVRAALKSAYISFAGKASRVIMRTLEIEQPHLESRT